MISYEDYQPKSTSRRKREYTEWSITYTFHATDETKPRVLLIGDSICNGYQDAVRRELEEKTHLTYWISSKCVTDPDYFKELALILGGYRYDVITLNNGAHSWGTDIAEWEEAYRAVLRFIGDACPDAKRFAVLSTPFCVPDKKAAMEALNGIVLRLADEAKIPVIDLFTPMLPYADREHMRDEVHFQPAYSEMQGKIIAEQIAPYLK